MPRRRGPGLSSCCWCVMILSAGGTDGRGLHRSIINAVQSDDNHILGMIALFKDVRDEYTHIYTAAFAGQVKTNPPRLRRSVCYIVSMCEASKHCCMHAFHIQTPHPTFKCMLSSLRD